MKPNKIYLAGHEGMVGSSIYNKLIKKYPEEIITCSHKDLDLTRQIDVEDFIKKNKPEVVIIAAARVGGIQANNTYTADFIYQNTMIVGNLIHSSFKNGITKIINLGSACIYPKHSIQPMSEEELLSGAIEPTNEAYAIAKITGLKFCQFYNSQHNTKYFTIMPANAYGPNDNFDLNEGHVIANLIRKFHEAKENNEKSVTVWGSGNQKREFIYVEDIASSIIFLLQKMRDDTSDLNSIIEHNFMNIGTGEEISIFDLAHMIKKIINFKGHIEFDKKMPDGSPRRVLDSSKFRSLGWKPDFNLEQGLQNTYNWYLEKAK